jgi:diguanylate cyclase (GGDEF)-like protein
MLIATAYVVPVGVLVFVFLQALILARHYSLAFVRVEELFREKTKLEGTALTLRNLTLLDALTGIANRRRFDQYLVQEWRRAARKKTCLACIMMDIDHFKRFNDTHGHPAGDEALRKIAGALGRSVRRPADLVVRYGGEEFAALLPDTDLAGAQSLAEKIRTTVLELAIPRHDAATGTEGSEVPEVVTLSLGCAATVPNAAETDPLVLVRMADAALYRAKERGRNRTELEPDNGCPGN